VELIGAECILDGSWIRHITFDGFRSITLKKGMLATQTRRHKEGIRAKIDLSGLARGMLVQQDQ
jgi:hypothetical protein